MRELGFGGGEGLASVAHACRRSSDSKRDHSKHGAKSSGPENAKIYIEQHHVIQKKNLYPLIRRINYATALIFSIPKKKTVLSVLLILKQHSHSESPIQLKENFFNKDSR